MIKEKLESAFAKMGAKVVFREYSPWARQEYGLDVSRDGKSFIVNTRPGFDVDFTVLDIQPKERHLLLLARYPEGRREMKSKFLMGHDERHWFVAAVPEIASGVVNVLTAKQALKPSEVVEREAGLKTKHRHTRKNSAWLRQGEWFFVSAPDYDPGKGWKVGILKNEPIVRSRGGKPHMCEFLYRTGGETVYVSRKNQDGLSEAQYSALSDKERREQNWQVMKRNPTVYVRGAIRHPDHKTVNLGCWHRVFSNTETLSYAMRNVVFLD